MITHQLIVDFERLAMHEANSARGNGRNGARGSRIDGPSVFETARFRTTNVLRRLANAIEPVDVVTAAPRGGGC